jgi:hypothetical protein
VFSERLTRHIRVERAENLNEMAAPELPVGAVAFCLAIWLAG